VTSIQLIVITKIFVQGFKGKVRGVNVKLVDTTGAGDAFVSGILYNIASDPSIFEVIQTSSHILVVDLEKKLRVFGVDASILCGRMRNVSEKRYISPMYVAQSR